MSLFIEITNSHVLLTTKFALNYLKYMQNNTHRLCEKSILSNALLRAICHYCTWCTENVIRPKEFSIDLYYVTMEHRKHDLLNQLYGSLKNTANYLKRVILGTNYAITITCSSSKMKSIFINCCTCQLNPWPMSIFNLVYQLSCFQFPDLKIKQIIHNSAD